MHVNSKDGEEYTEFTSLLPQVANLEAETPAHHT